MPRLGEAMKDVLDCEKPRGAARSFDTGISEWGNPLYRDIEYPFLGGKLRGSETSQTLKELKPKRDPKTAGRAEMGNSPRLLGTPKL